MTSGHPAPTPAHPVRTLILLRHAKAERPDGPVDIDRSLTERGQADALASGAWLAGRSLTPDLVICSPSKRTRQTWHGVAQGLAAGLAAGASAPRISYERRVYDGGADDLLALVQAVDDEVGTVLLIGHNPSVSVLSARLDPEGAADDSDGLRTAGLAVHEVNGSWAELGGGPAPVVARHTARGRSG